MELNIRRLKETDWDTLVSWWSTWPEWENPPQDFLPDNGKGGFMVEKNNTPIVAGFLYLTNSKGVLLEWIVSNPEYRDKDRYRYEIYSHIKKIYQTSISSKITFSHIIYRCITYFIFIYLITTKN